MKVKFLRADNGDSILINFLDENKKARNILIDGGMDATYFDRVRRNGALKKEIDNLKQNDEVIDLLILSHIDNDHIKGLLKWFELDKNAPELINEVWFNSGEAIATTFNKSKNEDLDVYVADGSNVLTGVDEGIEFQEYLKKNALSREDLISRGFTYEKFGLKIDILTPTKKQLTDLLELYKEETGKAIYTGSRDEDWSRNLKDIIEDENKPSFRFRQDRSEKNGSSITSLIDYKDTKFLLTADSHPKQVSKSLRDLGYSKENPVELEFMQVSHHGSKANNNKELLDLIKTNNYIISTNSSGHGHPHKSTIARIAKRNSKATIFSNYEIVVDNILTTKDRKDFPELNVKLISEYQIR